MNDKLEMYEKCIEEPSTIFKIINKCYYDVVDELLENKKIDINICDTLNNSLCIRLLKVKQYDLVLKIIKRRNFNVNYQNNEGNTLSHFLTNSNDIRTIKVIEELIKKSNYNPNIRNNNGETSFDKAINNNYLIGALKLFEDKRFNLISLDSFTKLYQACMKDTSFGKNAKKDNFKMIMKSLKKKNLNSDFEKFINKIESNKKIINEELSNDKNNCIDVIFNSILQTA